MVEFTSEQKREINIREKLVRQESNTEISSGETDGSAGNSKRSRIVCDDDEAQDDPVVKTKTKCK